MPRETRLISLTVLFCFEKIPSTLISNLLQDWAFFQIIHPEIWYKKTSQPYINPLCFVFWMRLLTAMIRNQCKEGAKYFRLYYNFFYSPLFYWWTVFWNRCHKINILTGKIENFSNKVPYHILPGFSNPVCLARVNCSSKFSTVKSVSWIWNSW